MAAGVAAAGSGGSRATTVTVDYLNALIEEARTNNPGLRAARAMQEAAAVRTESVRVWEDPEFRFGGTVASSRGPELSEDGDLTYGLEQKLPLFGKARRARVAAQAESQLEEARAAYRFQVLRRDVAQAAYRLALGDATIALGLEDLGVIEQLIQVSRQRHQSGLNGHTELLRLETEAARRRVQVETDRQHRRVQGSVLDRWLNREAEVAWPELALPEARPEVAWGDRLGELAERFEPRLKVLRLETGAAEAGLDVTQRSRLPDFGLGIDGRQYTGDGGFREGTFTLGMTLPWWNRGKYRSDVQRDRARVAALRAEVEDQALAVRQEVRRVWVQADAQRRLARLYRDEIIPRTELELAGARASWAAGRGEFLHVMDARRLLADARLQYARAVAEQHLMLTELVLCCGLGDLEALEMLSGPRDAERTK
jgi:cobalt-zinc-cadmium efflux system outer membrane protein